MKPIRTDQVVLRTYNHPFEDGIFQFTDWMDDDDIHRCIVVYGGDAVHSPVYRDDLNLQALDMIKELV